MSIRQLIPFRQPRIEHAVDDDVGDRGMVGMDTRAGRGEDRSRPMHSKEAGDLQPRLHGVADEAVLQRQRRALYA